MIPSSASPPARRASASARRRHRRAARLALIGWLMAMPALAQNYDTMAAQPNPRDFVKRSGTSLTLIGNPFRFSGVNLSWLGLRSDSGKPADERYPTPFEIGDGLATVQAVGGSAIRVLSAGVTAGCARCLMPAPGQINEGALAQIDLVLKAARDAGLKVIIPLAGPGRGCGLSDPDPVADTECRFAAWRGKSAGDFYTDPMIRDDFTRAALALITHVNSLTGTAYKDDPTILAWENCDGCGQGVAADRLAAWTEALGQAIKRADPHHLYENGAFAGRIGQGPARASAAQLGLASVDILGDRVGPSSGPSTVPASGVADAVDAANAAGRAYVIDAYGWAPVDFPNPSDLEDFLGQIAENPSIAGAFVTELQGHADQGGYLPGAQWVGAPPPLYFPGIDTKAADAATMQARARIVRRFAYKLIHLPTPAFLTVDQPDLLDASGGRLRWRGAAGAIAYSVERTSDPTAQGSWKTVCDRCVNDTKEPWRDPSMPSGPVWYRVVPFNANYHAGNPSDPKPGR